MGALARTFLVESYVPGLDAAAAAALAARLRAAVIELRGEAVDVSWVGSYALVEEETCIWLLEAADAGDVARVHRRAGVSGEHVAEVTATDRAACSSVRARPP